MGISPSQQRFRVVALLPIRDNEFYLERCITHLVSQGIEICIIDNDSSDRCPEISASYLGRGVVGIKKYPHPGYYDWRGILRYEEKLSYEIDADWFMHHDVDEIREAPRQYANLKEAIYDVDRKGFNAINFNEFVFVPTDERKSFEHRDYVKEMKYYYFFQPRPYHRTNTWKKTNPVDLADSGGHTISFEGRKVFDQNFILRHYLALSKNHLISKYTGRVHSPEELKLGWHKKRAAFDPESFKFPDKKNLHEYKEDGAWDISSPRTSHFFEKTGQV